MATAVERAEAAYARAEAEVQYAKAEHQDAKAAYKKACEGSKEKTLQYELGVLQAMQATIASAHCTVASALSTLASAKGRLTKLQAEGGIRSHDGDEDISITDAAFQFWKDRAYLASSRITGLSYSVGDLADPSKRTVLWLPVMDVAVESEEKAAASGSKIGAVPHKFWFLGRNHFNSVLEFVREVPEGQVAYYTGLPGGGKSYIFAAVAVELFREFAKSESGGCRIIYLQGSTFLTKPYESLQKALLLAYPTAQLEGFPFAREASLYNWVTSQEDRLLFLVDDCEAFDRGRKRKFASAPLEERGRAYSFLQSLATGRHSVVKCCSIRSEVYRMITGHKIQVNLVASPIFSEEELKQYLLLLKNDMHAKIFGPDGNSYLEPDGKYHWDRLMVCTGGNPRLVHVYNTGDFELAIERAGNAIGKFICTADVEALIDFMSVVAGNPTTTRLPQAMLAKCFYVKDGKGACISDRLLQVARARLAVHLHLSAQKDKDRVLSPLLQTMPVETKKSRLGHNAEAAVILVVKHHTTIEIPQITRIDLKPVRVEVLPNEFVLSDEPAGVMYVPKGERHKGLDFYYTDEQNVICFQVTVARDAEGSHPQTYSEFVRRTAHDKRKKYLIWVVHGEDSTISTNSDITQVFCCFADLHCRLRIVDEAGIRIDREKAKECKPGVEPTTCKAIAKRTNEPCRKLAKANGFCHFHDPQRK